MFGRDKSGDNMNADDVTVPMQDISAPPLPDPSQSLTLPAPQADDQSAATDDGSMSVPVTVNSSTAPVDQMPPTPEVPAEMPETPSEEPAPEISLPEPESMEAESAPMADPATPDVNDMGMESEAPAEPEAEPEMEAEETMMPAEPTSAPVSSTGDLSSLKQDAMRELSPLMHHLDQTPEEAYATAKMMYEETKDNAFLNKIFEAAKNITDEKAKAAAIYDVITKINQLG